MAKTNHHLNFPLAEYCTARSTQKISKIRPWNHNLKDFLSSGMLGILFFLSYLKVSILVIRLCKCLKIKAVQIAALSECPLNYPEIPKIDFF